MNNLKRIAILLAIFTVLVLFSVGYKGNDILARAIVLGVGIDLTEEGELSVTAEIVSPGNGGEQVGMFSKTVTATGKTVAEALKEIAVKAGKETSLGQMVLIVLGEDYIKTDFSDTVSYFIRSDSCKESCIICCCQGRAEELLNCGDAVSQSVSLSLADKLKGLSKDVAIPASDLLSYTRSQMELFRTGFLNYVTYEESKNTSTVNPEQKQVFFSADRVAVFRKNKIIGILSQQETQGFAILNNEVAGNVFPVKDKEGKYLTLRANSKNVDSKQKDGVVSIAVTIEVKLSRTDSFGAGGIFTAKTDSEIPQEMLDQVKQQSIELAKAFLSKQVEWEFDILKIHEIFRQKYGSTKDIQTLPMKAIPVNLTIEVKEK